MSFAFNALISAPAEAIGPAIHEGKEGEQHAEDLGLMDALRGRARAHFAERINCKKGRLLNELTAKSGPKCVAERIKRVFEKFYLGASRLSMRRMAARSMKASEVWTFNSF